ncbi:hypothetical protein B1H20_16940 [Streptomyces violaceoruber]|uniref:DUF3558 domain-containing protein n=1 Tax=Streptomyces violaceoruber TaxID=1935 RepID=A0A1V0UCQ8_STRVN|nr:hypothetical protein [Streptomyces violaceoruber]ARF62887.1 hypothetical protein B1H20_16940 [Streptomyces violaceoruber]
MRTRTITAAVTGATLLLALVACDPAAEPTTESKPSAPSSSQPAGLTAKKAAAGLADATGVKTLGDPQDNTAGCSQEAAGEKPHANDCSQLITTDTVSIYEFETPKVAAHWVKQMGKQQDWRQVDRFALAFGARDQALTSDERRDELTRALEALVAKE